MFKPKALTIAIVSSALFLTACNSNDDDNVALPNATTTITVTPSLGKILNARVALKNATTGATIAATKTLTPSDNGTATFTVPIKQLAEPILAEVLPTTAGKVEYFDEALEQNKTITVAAADIAKPILRAAASVTANANIGVTGLTEAAVQQAEKQVGGLIAQNINNANTAVKNALNLNFNITQAPIVIGNGEFEKLVNAALDAQRRAYATYLATLAKEAQRINAASATPAYDMAKAFANDFAHDGVFNAVGSQALAINYSNAFLTNWVNWVSNFYASFLNLQTIVDFNRWYGGFNIANKESVKAYPDAVPIRTVDGVEEYACSGEGRIKSSQSDGISMDFVNQRGSNMSIYWLDYSAKRVSYKQNLPTGQTHVQGTFVTHPWLITDNTGACMGIYRPVTKTNKTITFKTDGLVMIGNNDSSTPTSCTTGVETTFATTATNAPYTNGQKVCFNASTTSLAFNSKTLSNPVRNTAVQSPYSAYAFKDGSYSYEVIFNNNALYEINLSLTSFLGQFTPTVTTPIVATCASKSLPVAMLSSITDYNGDYKDASSDIVFKLSTSTAKASVKGTEADIKEVCGPTNLSNGTNHVLITDKGDVTLFKTTAGVYSAEGQEFVDKNKVFYGEKASAVTNNCSSTGNDTKLGFKNAPSDFCSFSYTYGTSTSISSPDIYTFKDATDPMANAKVTVLNGSVQTFQLENSKYAYACGVGNLPACVGITIQSNTNSNIEFKFANVQVANVDTTKQGMIIDSGLLMHKKSVAVTTLAATGTASGTVTNVQYNKDGSATGGSGAVTANTYKFSGDLSTAYTLEINDTARGLRYQLANREGRFTAVNLYSGANSASPLFVYTCDTTGDNTCLAKVTFTLEGTPTLNFTNMKLRGVFQPQFDAIINGQFKLNP
ncbi:MAG: hypothetical protein KDI39_11240 [Pseudomonadales bacterium]|nr:hypothetical protein [Pseudomonadales bacterium]